MDVSLGVVDRWILIFDERCGCCCWTSVCAIVKFVNDGELVFWIGMRDVSLEASWKEKKDRCRFVCRVFLTEKATDFDNMHTEKKPGVKDRKERFEQPTRDQCMINYSDDFYYHFCLLYFIRDDAHDNIMRQVAQRDKNTFWSVVHRKLCALHPCLCSWEKHVANACSTHDHRLLRSNTHPCHNLSEGLEKNGEQIPSLAEPVNQLRETYFPLFCHAYNVCYRASYARSFCSIYPQRIVIRSDWRWSCSTLLNSFPDFWSQQQCLFSAGVVGEGERMSTWSFPLYMWRNDVEREREKAKEKRGWRTNQPRSVWYRQREWANKRKKETQHHPIPLFVYYFKYYIQESQKLIVFNVL